MTLEDYNLRLAKKGVKPTPNRILVYKALLEADESLSLPDLEAIIDTMDKSSIFRVLAFFLEHEVIHAFEDGSGMHKYEICEGPNESGISQMHVHFYCECCHRTFCFKHIKIPEVELPDGFSSHAINYIAKGICDTCRKKQEGKN